MEEHTNADTDKAARKDLPKAADDRRTATDPASDPHPLNPPQDHEAVEKGREILERVKPY
jgi:hypothetical protein